jgi:hypothetical protein
MHFSEQLLIFQKKLLQFIYKFHLIPSVRMQQWFFRIYVLPFLIWSACGLGIFFALQESDLLYTSIWGVVITDDISQSDVVISEQENGDIVFTAMKKIPDVEMISLVLTYDHTLVKIEETDISSPFQLNVSRANEGQLIITLQDVATIDTKSTLLTIRPTGESEHLTLSDVIAHFADSSTPLIVTSLN